MDNAHTIQDLEDIFENLIRIVLQLAGVATFIMLIVGGFKYLTAGSDPKKAQAARSTLTYAIGGLILVILAWFFLRAISEITNVNVTIFEIPD